MAGRWTSLQNGIGNLSGVAAPMLADFIVQTSGSSRWAFVVSALIVLMGALMWALRRGTGRAGRLAWTPHSEAFRQPVVDTTV